MTGAETVGRASFGPDFRSDAQASADAAAAAAAARQAEATATIVKWAAVLLLAGGAIAGAIFIARSLK